MATYRGIYQIFFFKITFKKDADFKLFNFTVNQKRSKPADQIQSPKTQRPPNLHDVTFARGLTHGRIRQEAGIWLKVPGVGTRRAPGCLLRLLCTIGNGN